MPKPIAILLYGIFRLLKLLFVSPLRYLARKLRPPQRHALTAYWQNAFGNQFTAPRSLERPTSLGELDLAIAAALAQGRRVRAVGSGHSFSDVAIADDVLIDPHGVTGVLPLEVAVLAPHANPDTLVRVASGTTIAHLNDALYAMGLALENMGGYDAQTVSGAISTATHGSGFSLGPLCDIVESVEIHSGRGPVVLEPADGITDPSAYDLAHPNGPPLLQRDDLFYSAVVAMGSMGIVTAYTLRVRPRFLLREQRNLVEWAALRPKLVAGVYRDVAHFEVLVSPYVIQGKRWCLTTTRVETTSPGRSVDDKTRNPLATFATTIRSLDRLLLFLFLKIPRIAPWLIRSALDALKDKTYVDRSYKVFNLGDANHVPAYASELALDAEIPERGEPSFITAVEEFFRLAELEFEHGKTHTSPVSLRFVAASKHYLAPQYGRLTCMMEIPFLGGTPCGWDLLRYYERRLLPYGARPHWGQWNTLVGSETAANLYPKLPAWLSAFEHLNPTGAFDNVFTERLGFRAALQKKLHYPARG